MNSFMSRVRAENPGLIVMVRPDSRSLRLNAFTKRDGEKSWSKYHESVAILLGIMLPSAAAPLVASAGASASAVADAGAPAASESMQADPPSQ